MAHLVEETINIKISRLVKNKSDATSIIDATADLLITLESVTQEMVGNGAVVDISVGQADK